MKQLKLLLYVMLMVLINHKDLHMIY